MCVCVLCVCIDCTRKWIGNAVQNVSSSSVQSRDKIARVQRAPRPAGLGISAELPKFAEMLLENDVAFITP